MNIAEAVKDVLEPYVGHMVADTCVRATALSIGKTSDTLDAADLPPLENNVRKLLLPIAPSSTIDALIAQIERNVA
ncbi:MAG: hypothetical protein C0418_00190 [Coriobacteriaceae bacterium]|nr:hypothetical protein [Coriobacteriaceae bacterium]